MALTSGSLEPRRRISVGQKGGGLGRGLQLPPTNPHKHYPWGRIRGGNPTCQGREEPGQEGAHPRGARPPSRPRSAGAAGTDARPRGRRDPGGSGAVAAGCYTPTRRRRSRGSLPPTHPGDTPSGRPQPHLPFPGAPPSPTPFAPDSTNTAWTNSPGCPARKKTISSKSFISSFRPTQFLLFCPAVRPPGWSGGRRPGGHSQGAAGGTRSRGGW